MNAVLTQLLTFVGRHWLRVGLVLMTLFLLTRKQIDLSVQLGRPATQPAYQAAPRALPTPNGQEVPIPIEADPSLAQQPINRPQRLNVLGGGAEVSASFTALEQLRRIDESRIQSFLSRFEGVAKTEQARYGIPASITLANGLLNGQAGQRADLQTSNNYFRLPCTSDWRGETTGAGEACLRVYPNAWTSFRDHSLFITTGRFANLSNQHATDYRAWARGMEQIGYPGGDGLAEQLVAVIQEYGLARYDQ